MARPQKTRRLTSIPAVSGFRPYGNNVRGGQRNAVFLLLEEYEALKLNDYEHRIQCDAAQIMQVSRPTLTRIYMSARQKIATAFVEGRQIIIEGGKVEYTKGWFLCNDCRCTFDKMEEHDLICPLCKSQNLEEYVDEHMMGEATEKEKPDEEFERRKFRHRGHNRENNI